jgi:16S rRNA (cytidine1402-2'-O)-methyltransferase
MRLVVVPTPIGNLGDITIRGEAVLRECDLVLCEDTRETRKLLSLFGIEKPLISHHQHNEHQSMAFFLAKIRESSLAVLVTDAGTPGISDPGFLLIRECIRHEIPVECLPGATAFVPAIVVSGIPCDRFVFEGFLPHKKGRETRIKAIAQESRTIVLYESPHRLLKTIQQLMVHCGSSRECSVSREISKKFEETVRGPLDMVFKHFSQKEPRGEFVIVLAGNSGAEKPNEDSVEEID